MCCSADSSKPLGKISDDTSIVDLWNSDKMKEKRLAMLANEELPECSRCYEIEATGGRSLRIDHLEKFKHHLPIVSTTTETGNVDAVNIPFMDIRFSNICNLRCRTCGPELSSRWFSDAKKLSGIRSGHAIAIQTPTTNPAVLWQYIDSLLDSVEVIYFAGGEPLMTDEHYRILTSLVQKGRTNVKLEYNTNFTVMSYKDMQVMEIWNKFKSVSVGASIDGYGDRFEYIRAGATWEVIVQNRIEMQRICPHVRFFINFTLSVFNYDMMPELHKTWIENGLISPGGFNINFLMYPTYYKTTIISDEMRDAAIVMYQQHIQWLTDMGFNNAVMHERWESALRFINQPQSPHDLVSFRNLTRRLDELRGESFIDTFPNLGVLLE
jgi:organic radical activating enzyme